MGGVLVVGSVADDCAAVVDALSARGVDAVAVPDDGDLELAARGKEAILVDLDAAIERGWVRGAKLTSRPTLPLIVMSRHEAFLDIVRDQVSACLHTPFDIDEALATIQRVVDAVPPAAMTRSVSVLDVSGRDLSVRRFLAEAADPQLIGIASLIARGTHSDIALISILDSQRQTFVGHAGVDVDLLTAGGTPRDWSFCTHTLASGERLVITDARHHPAFADNPLVESQIVGAYAGVPILVEGFGVVGTVCAISTQELSMNAPRRMQPPG